MNILEHIEARGMTKAAVCRMAGISRPTLYWLAAGHPVTIKTLIAVARVLDLKPSDIRPELAE